ncbi:MAG TPA: SpaA isopeptide-forming pilin-related protein, partial [Candidatus Limiplasma sp.]|nr:SpaA isopeptide-forming pilin-related protein [Candidatus Limiplasma sp.]
ITDSNGLADVTGILALDQWYVVTEDLAGTPAGYTTATASAPFQLSADGTKEITLTDPRTVFRVGKLDSRDHTTLLAGATLTIYDSMVDADGKTVPNLAAAPVATVVTEAGVTTPIYGLLLGHTYFLYESVAPDGYLRNTDTYTKFEIDADGKTAVYSVDAPSSVKLRKTDAAGNAITGATLALVMGEDAVNYDPATDVINTWTSDKLTDHTEYQLLLNTPYTLVETGAPAGYTLNTAGVTFKLDDNGQVVLLRGGTADATTVDLVSMGDQSIHVVFSKNATGNLTAELPNANLKITHTDATLGEVTDDAWQTAAVNPSPHVVTTTLRADDTTVYTFTEVGAPAGYTIAGSISFKLDLNGNVKIQQPDGSFVAPADNKVVMTDAPITFLIAKQNEDGDYLAGAEFEIVPDIEGKPGETAVTGFSKIVSEDQPTEVSGLPAGSYWLVETKAPVGIDASGNPVYYKLAQPKAFTVTDELLTGDQRVTVTVTDSPTTVTVLKLDSDQLDANQNPTGNRVKDVTVTLTRKGETTVLDTFTFDGFKDWVLTPGLIEPGATYTLTETATPADYLSFGSMDFTMEADGDARWILVNTLIAKRSITVNKVWSNSAVARQPVTIDLYRSDDLTTPYRSLPLPITADSVTFDNLPDKASNGAEYTYTLAESTATGYLPGVFTGPTVSADQKAYAYTLTNKPTALVVSKMAADTATELPGATLRIVKGNGVGYADSDIVETWQSGSDGQNADGTYKSHTLYGKLEPAKQYTLLEVSAPNGYLPAVSLTFTYTPDSNGSRTLTLTDQPTRVRFGKLDNLTGTLVEGATFDVYDDAAWQSNPSTAKPVFSFTSKTTYVETVAKLTAGKLYRLVETGAPAGYQLNGATLQFRAPSDSGTATVTLSDPRIYYFAKISASTGLAVPKAKLKVTDSSGNTVIPEWTSTGEPYEFVNTDTNGEPILKSGVTYRLVEVSAPDGYELNSTAVTFTLDSKGLINGGTTVTMTNTPVDTPTDDTIDLTIHKTWVDNGNAGNTRPTAGLTVNVYRKLSTQTDYSLMMSVTVPTRNSNNWYLTILGLDRYDNSGVEYNYRAREVVPTGYTVTYANNGFTMVNTYPGNGESPTPTPITTLTPTPNASTTRVPTSVKYVDGQWVYIDDNQVPLGVVPQTGDESNYLLWGLAIVLPLLLAAMAGWFVFRKKRRDAKTGADKA